MFSDLACSLGAILLEQYIVDDLLGGHSSYSYGNTYARPDLRLAFQRAAQKVTRTPGTMIYGATTMYGANHAENYAALATYLRIDIYGERTRPAGHAVNPTPVTEAERIPDIDEIIDVHIFANRLAALKRRWTVRPRGRGRCGRRPDRRKAALPRKCLVGARGGGDRHRQSLRNAARHPPDRLGNASKPCSDPASRRQDVCVDPTHRALPIRIEQLEHDGEGLVSRLALPERERIVRASSRPASPPPTSMNMARSSSSRCCASFGIERSSMAASPPIPTTWSTRRGDDRRRLHRALLTMGWRCNSSPSSRGSMRNSALPVFIGGKLNRIRMAQHQPAGRHQRRACLGRRNGVQVRRQHDCIGRRDGESARALFNKLRRICPPSAFRHGEIRWFL